MFPLFFISCSSNEAWKAIKQSGQKLFACRPLNQEPFSFPRGVPLPQHVSNIDYCTTARGIDTCIAFHSSDTLKSNFNFYKQNFERLGLTSLASYEDFREGTSFILAFCGWPGGDKIYVSGSFNGAVSLIGLQMGREAAPPMTPW